MQGGHSVRPEHPVVRQPSIDLGQWLGPKAVDPALGVLPSFDQSGLAKYPEVTGNPGPGDRDDRSKFVDGRWVIAKDLEHGATVSVGDRMKHGVHSR